MKKYPRIYSLSTIGIIHHQKNDYIFHPYCTDFIGDSETFFGAFCFDQQMLHMLLRSGISIRIRATNFFTEISSML